MSAYIKEMEDRNKNRVYPVTVLEAVYMPDLKTSLGDLLHELMDGTAKTEFMADGSIKKTLGSGKVSTTVFGNGVITETCVYPDGSNYYTKVTTFNDDGSINVEMTYAEGV